MTTLEEIEVFQKEEFEKADKLTDNWQKLSDKELIQRMQEAIDYFDTDSEKTKGFHFDKNSDSYPLFNVYKSMCYFLEIYPMAILGRAFFVRTMNKRESKKKINCEKLIRN